MPPRARRPTTCVTRDDSRRTHELTGRVKHVTDLSIILFSLSGRLWDIGPTAPREPTPAGVGWCGLYTPHQPTPAARGHHTAPTHDGGCPAEGPRAPAGVVRLSVAAKAARRAHRPASGAARGGRQGGRAPRARGAARLEPYKGIWRRREVKASHGNARRRPEPDTARHAGKRVGRGAAEGTVIDALAHAAP